jgi:hypothetical protein
MRRNEPTGGGALYQWTNVTIAPLPGRTPGGGAAGSGGGSAALGGSLARIDSSAGRFGSRIGSLQRNVSGGAGSSVFAASGASGARRSGSDREGGGAAGPGPIAEGREEQERDARARGARGGGGDGERCTRWEGGRGEGGGLASRAAQARLTGLVPRADVRTVLWRARALPPSRLRRSPGPVADGHEHTGDPPPRGRARRRRSSQNLAPEESPGSPSRAHSRERARAGGEGGARGGRVQRHSLAYPGEDTAAEALDLERAFGGRTYPYVDAEGRSGRRRSHCGLPRTRRLSVGLDSGGEYPLYPHHARLSDDGSVAGRHSLLGSEWWAGCGVRV